MASTKVRTKDYIAPEVPETHSETIADEVKEKKPEKITKRMAERKFSIDHIRYTGDDAGAHVIKEYLDPAGNVVRSKNIDVRKIKEPKVEDRQKTYITFSNGLEYIKYLVSNRGYKML